VEFADAFALRVGDEGRGVPTIIQMVQLTRLDCAISSAGLMRMALAQAIHHARHRTVFQRRLIDQPAMRQVLADMALQSEAAVALVMRLCFAFDHASTDEHEAAYARLLTPAIKYWVCKSAPSFIYEAMECLGGNGYVEESMLPRLYREAPVNAIWEGSGNVMCLDVLRALSHDRDVSLALLDHLATPIQLRHVLGDAMAKLTGPQREANARAGVEELALIAAASALAQSAPTEIAEHFIATRLHDRMATMFGASVLEEQSSTAILQRALAV
jgi:putative acyl-CoA dehydrogenase